ncbi:MAG TPA: hydroxyacid dehydrogenase [Usitatibacter sp.]|jgi:(S)-sulfolactate dehydrogenase|nr:hydroxyacid dehydrogenase [Usitatibacter sp.]
MKRIVISEFMDAPAVEELRARFEVDYRPALVDDSAALATALPNADAWIVRNRTQVRGALLDAASKVRVVGRLGVGLDNIDVAACAARGIRVYPATGANAESVAEYVIAMALVLLRGAYLATAEVASGSWPRTALSGGREASGKTLGLVGFGSIGRITAGKARSLGLQVVAHDPQLGDDDPAWARHQVRPRSLDALLAGSDVVSLHVPLTPQTKGLLGRERLARMKRGAILVNTARGGVVDEAALAALLHDGHLGGAALDVFESEPLAAGSPLAGVPRLVLTPHIAGLTLESNARVSLMVAARVAEALST